MPGQTFSHCKEIKDVKSIVVHVFSEEEKQLSRVAGSVKVGELAEILGGEARNPHWIGKGWDGVELADAEDPQAVTLALGISKRKQTRVQAYSIIFDLPKGASVVVASDPELRQWFNETCRPKMMAAGMASLEAETVLQGWKAGKRDFPPVTGLRGWWAGHSISGAGDPHLHNHLIISATATAEDGRVGQIDSRSFLKRTVKIADASSKRVMMEEAAKVGLKFGLDGELCGVGAALIEGASNAHNAVAGIKAHFASEGTPISDEQAWKHYRQISAGKADKGLPATLVEQIRKSRGEGMTLSAEALEHSLDAALGDTEKAEAVGRWLATKYGMEEAEWTGLADRARAAALLEPEYSDVDRVLRLISTLKTAPKVVEVEALCARIVDADGRADLMERVGLDRRILVGDKHWVLTASYKGEIALRERVEKLLAEGHQGLAAADSLADLDSPLVVVSGVAGAGKSTSLQEASDVWRQAEVRVWASARNSLTAKETGRAAGAKESLSLAALAQRIARGSKNIPQAGDILVVDEWGVVDSAQVAMVLSLAERGVKVKLLGDQHQIQPIDGSSAARMVMDLARQRGAAELAKSYRTDKWSELHTRLRMAVTGVSDAGWAVRSMDIKEAASATEVVAIATEMGGEIAVQTNATRIAIAEALPRPEIPIDKSGEPIVAMLRDGIAGWKGDQVVVRKNVWVEHGAQNRQLASTGQTGSIQSVGDGQVVIEVDGRPITLSKARAREVLALGGVQTGDSAQGQTWERAVVVVTGTEAREWLYSTATRGTQAPIFIVMRDEDDDDERDARSVVKTVLEREGMAQTTEELATTDARLAQSIAESEPGWMPPEGSATEAKPEPVREPEPLRIEKVFEPWEFKTEVKEPMPGVTSEPEVKAEQESAKEPVPVRETLVRAVAEDAGFRSWEEIREKVGAFKTARAAYEDEANLVTASKGKLAAGVDSEYARYEKRKLVSMREASEAAREEALTAKRLRDGLLGPLTEDERAGVERLRVEKVKAERRLKRIEVDAEYEDRPYKAREKVESVGVKEPEVKGKSEPEPEPTPETAKVVELEPVVSGGRGFGRRRL